MDACCFRKGSTGPGFRTVRVVHLDGFVEDFEPPTTVNRVIGIFQKYFVTTPIRIMQFGLVPLKLDTLLEPGRIYFLLPNSILRFNESSDNLICLTRKLTQIAKTHRPMTKPPSNSARYSMAKPAPLAASRSLPKTIPSDSPSMALSAPSPNRSVAKPPPSPNRSKTKPPSPASSRDKRSRKISLTKKLSNIAKNHGFEDSSATSASEQDKGSSQTSVDENNNHKKNLAARRRAFAWKPLLSTIREMSFNRRESDLRDN